MNSLNRKCGQGHITPTSNTLRFSTTGRPYRRLGIEHCTYRCKLIAQNFPCTDAVVGRSLAHSLPTPDVVFDLATLSVMPLYALMIWMPKSKMTKTLMSSNIFFLAGAAVYGYLLHRWNIVDILAHVALMLFPNDGMSSTGFGLDHFAKVFQHEEITAITWSHLLLFDLFQARYCVTC